MAERASSLARMDVAEASDAAVTLRQAHFASILQVSAWPDTVDTVEAVIRELLGVDAPEIGRGIVHDNSRVVALAPGRFLVAARASDLVTRFEAALPTSEAAVTDLSHGRLILRLDGKSEELLAKVVAIDLAPTAFPAGRIAQTTVDHIDVLVHRLAPDSVELWAFRSFAESLVDWLLDAGLETGIAFSR
jgi:sarcosine oxidase subunit gamma